MAFPTTYTGWIAYVRDWLAADEISEAQIGTFLDLAVTRMNREFSSYGMEAKAPITVVDADPINIVSVVPDFNKIRLVSVRGVGPLDVDAINEMEKKRQTDADPDGDPSAYTIDAGLLYTYPAVPINGIIDFFYYKKIPMLSKGPPAVDSNVFTIDHPDAFLYASLMEAAPYMNEPEHLTIWESKYTTALAVANELSNRIKMGSTPLKRQITGMS